MADYPYMMKTSVIPEFLKRIPGIGKPDKVTTKFLESLGFKSTNDRPVVNVLKYIGFIDSSNIPTERWVAYRSTQKGPAVLAAAIRDSYSDLFRLFPNANKRSDEELRNFFATNTTVAGKTVGGMVSTFRALCELADFDRVPAESIAPPPPSPDGKADSEKREGSAIPPSPPLNNGMSLSVNIQITLPETKDEDIYDKIFASLKRHFGNS